MVNTLLTRYLRELVDGCPGGAPAESPPDSSDADVGRHVGGVDVLVRKKEAAEDLHLRLLAEVVLRPEKIHFYFSIFYLPNYTYLGFDPTFHTSNLAGRMDMIFAFKSSIIEKLQNNNLCN
jgi:hypothetical protein